MENQKNDNLNMLEAIVQNTEMGKNTLDQLVPMAEDEQFKAELLRQRNIYRQLNQEAHAAIDACGGSAQGQSAMAKLNTKVSIGMKTITSNVVYGKYTGALPDGRAAFTPFAPGANPSYGAEQNGLLASLNSVAKLPYHWALDGISNTQTINPDALGHSEGERVENLVQVMDGYFDQGAHHLNVNVFGKEKLIDAMEHPEKEEYSNFTIRVSGYAVKFIDLTREQQMDVISRTCHAAL